MNVTSIRFCSKLYGETDALNLKTDIHAHSNSTDEDMLHFPPGIRTLNQSLEHEFHLSSNSVYQSI